MNGSNIILTAFGMGIVAIILSLLFQNKKSKSPAQKINYRNKLSSFLGKIGGWIIKYKNNLLSMAAFSLAGIIIWIVFPFGDYWGWFLLFTLLSITIFIMKTGWSEVLKGNFGKKFLYYSSILLLVLVVISTATGIDLLDSFSFSKSERKMKEIVAVAEKLEDQRIAADYNELLESIESGLPLTQGEAKKLKEIEKKMGERSLSVRVSKLLNSGWEEIVNTPLDVNNWNSGEKESWKKYATMEPGYRYVVEFQDNYRQRFTERSRPYWHTIRVEGRTWPNWKPSYQKKLPCPSCNLGMRIIKMNGKVIPVGKKMMLPTVRKPVSMFATVNMLQIKKAFSANEGGGKIIIKRKKIDA